MRNTRTTITYAILETLAEFGRLTLDSLVNKYPVVGQQRQKSRAAQLSRRSFSTILNRLKKEGLVTCSGPNRKAVWYITKNGTKLCKNGEPRNEYRLPPVLPPTDRVVRLVTFDVPEREKRAREWLRIQLLASGFKPLHKSVYLGKRPLHADLVKELDYRNLSRYVHIVALNRTGTLTKTTPSN